ncbi:AN1-type zinc finger protein 4 [Oopsacas minuta]|uniref:AN1-type zinc finger protein 4 n=1 Tax=Oopsacas minuta TaxID=111878 RepID=A0AAV7JPR4_9METZ|nr:AN1-type zinc finger protein 4 [Oopsacas minuta]
MEIIVEPVSGEPFIITVNRFLTVFSLKLKLQRLLGLPISQMILVHNHQELGDDNTLCEYGIITGSRIQLLEDSAQSSAQDSEEDYYNRLTILLVDGDNLNVIQMGDSSDWEANGFAEQWEDLVQQYEALQNQRRESYSPETNRFRRKVEQMKQKLQKRKKKINIDIPTSTLLPERSTSRTGNSYLNSVAYKQSNNYSHDTDHVTELPSINRGVTELKKEMTSQVRVPLSLPSIKPSEEPHKKKPRCTVCNKKLRILSAFVCKCKKQFCSKHRYAETHTCDYNYKEEERKLLAKNNPLVVASKLPKI